MDSEALHILLATGVVLVWIVIFFGWLCTWDDAGRDSSHAARFADRGRD